MEVLQVRLFHARDIHLRAAILLTTKLMPNIFIRIFGWSVLLERLADRDMQIVNLKTRVSDLEDRLFQRHGMMPSGEQSSQPHVAVPAWLTGRQRLHRMVEPKVNLLTEEDEKMLEGSLTQ